MLCGSRIKIQNLANHIKKNETKNIRLLYTDRNNLADLQK